MKEIHRIRFVIAGLLLFALLLFLMACNSTQFLNFTDEADNFLAGMSLAAGKWIYTDYTSQHMPLLYFICGFFSLIGASGMLQFRLCFYILLAGLFVLFCMRNRDRVPMKFLIFVPLLYVFNMVGDYNVCALSDQLQAYGMIVLLFEFCRFTDTRTVDFKMSFWVAFSILLSFGSAFVSAFAILPIVTGVIGIEVRLAKDQHMRLGAGIGNFFRKYAALFALSLFPFIVLVIVYACHGSLVDLIFGAYQVNTEYYSAYSGVGSHFLESLLDPFLNYGKYFLQIVRGFWSHRLLYTKEILCYVVNVVFFICTFRRDKWKAVILFCFVILCGSRGFGSVFHALPYYAVTLGMFAMLLQNFSGQKVLIPVFAVAIAVFTLPYLQSLGNYQGILGEWEKNMEIGEGSYEDYLCRLTGEEEDILYATVDYSSLVNAGRLNANIPFNTPWTYDAYYDFCMEELENDPPRVLLYSPNYQVWGIDFRDYAEEAWNYLEDHYQCLFLPSCPELYVRKDYYEEACAICNVHYFAQEEYHDGTDQITVAAGSVLTQTISGNGGQTNCVALLIQTCYDIGGITGDLRILSEDGMVLAQCSTDFSGWTPDGFYFIETDPVILQEGELYTLELSVESTGEGTGCSLYLTDDGDPETKASVDQAEIAGDFCYGIFSYVP